MSRLGTDSYRCNFGADKATCSCASCFIHRNLQQLYSQQQRFLASEFTRLAPPQQKKEQRLQLTTKDRHKRQQIKNFQDREDDWAYVLANQDRYASQRKQSISNKNITNTNNNNLEFIEDIQQQQKTEEGFTLNNEEIKYGDKVECGKNDVCWVINSNGLPLESSGTLREYFKNEKRSSDEKKSQKQAAQLGLSDDHGGHLVAHRFVRNQGDKNLFPQNKQFNNSAFKTLENDYGRFIDMGYSVKFKHKLVYPDPADKPELPDRPHSIEIFYQVYDADGNLEDEKYQTFKNQANETYERAI